MLVVRRWTSVCDTHQCVLCGCLVCICALLVKWLCACGCAVVCICTRAVLYLGAIDAVGGGVVRAYGSVQLKPSGCVRRFVCLCCRIETRKPSPLCCGAESNRITCNYRFAAQRLCIFFAYVVNSQVASRPLIVIECKHFHSTLVTLSARLRR